MLKKRYKVQNILIINKKLNELFLYNLMLLRTCVAASAAEGSSPPLRKQARLGSSVGRWEQPAPNTSRNMLWRPGLPAVRVYAQQQATPAGAGRYLFNIINE